MVSIPLSPANFSCDFMWARSISGLCSAFVI